MKSRTTFYAFVILILIALSGVWIFYKLEDEVPTQTFPATINRDCAPWDGSAFTILIPISDKANIAISIYQSPSIRRPMTFSFPDETMRVGNASLLFQDNSSQQLSGRVFFQHVEQGVLTEGKFDLHTETGEQFKGRFQAEWGNEVVMCG
jgi:hypothetical protein